MRERRLRPRGLRAHEISGGRSRRLRQAQGVVMRVLLVGGRGGGGEEVFVRDLAGDPPLGVTYTLLLDPHESAPLATAQTVREILMNRLIHPFIWPLPGFRAYDVRPGVDLVHLHNFPAWLRLPRGCPVVASVGGSSYPHYLETYLGWTPARVAARYRRARWIYRILGVHSDLATHESVAAIVVFSDYAASFLRRLGVPASKLRVIPPGFDIPLPTAPRRREAPFTFLLVGRHPERKGADLALKATRMVRSQGRDIRLLLVGDAAYPGMSVEGTVEGVGPVDRATLFRDYYGKADAVLVPSRAEGFGFAAVEGMGHGLPVIVSRRDALPWIVGDGGSVVEPLSAEALATAMAELAADPLGARAIGAEGRRRFEAIFTRQAARASLGELYQSLSGRP
ncbi:MAG: glycosyltransferase family 4 protein [Longimicrobiales bacterium]